MDSLSDHLLPILVHVGSGVRDTVGLRGAQAVFRQVGRKMAKQLASEPSPTLTLEQAQQLAANQLQGLAVFERVTVTDGIACMVSCALGRCLEQLGEKPGEHPLCFLGFGMIEGTIHERSGNQIRVRLGQRDPVKCVCCEPWHERVD